MAKAVPDTMRALVISGPGGIESLVESTLPTPVPGPGEVLISVHTVAANHQDHFVLRGLGNIAGVALPHVLGNDPAGVIAAVGPGVPGSRLGERVVVKPAIACDECEPCRAGSDDACERLRSVGVHRHGGFAEYLTVPGQNAFPIPDRLEFAAATALAQSFPVALTLLRKAGLHAEDIVLVAGAAGAIGAAAVQLSRLAGATVVAAAGSPGRVEYAVGLGAQLGIDYRADPSFADTVRQSFPQGVSLYVEPAGNPTIWAEGLRSVGRQGRVAVCGSHAGPIVQLDLLWLFRMRVSIFGSAGATRAIFAEILELAGEDRIEATIDSVRPLWEARDAFERLVARQNRGKLVLELGR